MKKSITAGTIALGIGAVGIILSCLAAIWPVALERWYLWRLVGEASPASKLYAAGKLGSLRSARAVPVLLEEFLRARGRPRSTSSTGSWSRPGASSSWVRDGEPGLSGREGYFQAILAVGEAALPSLFQAIGSGDSNRERVALAAIDVLTSERHSAAIRGNFLSDPAGIGINLYGYPEDDAARRGVLESLLRDPELSEATHSAAEGARCRLSRGRTAGSNVGRRPGQAGH